MVLRRITYPGAFYRNYQQPDYSKELKSNAIEKHIFGDNIGYLKIYGNKTDINKIPVILAFHGNGDTAENFISHLNQIIISRSRIKNFAVFVPEYNSYIQKDNTHGIEVKKPSEKSLKQDALNSYNYLVGKLGIDPEKMIISGMSLGSYPALSLAATGKKSSLYIADHPIASTREVILNPTNSKLMNFLLLPITLLVFCMTYFFAAKLDNKTNISNAKDQNITIIAGINDEILPKEFHAEKLANLNRRNKYMEVVGRHNDGTIEYLNYVLTKIPEKEQDQLGHKRDHFVSRTNNETSNATYAGRS